MGRILAFYHIYCTPITTGLVHDQLTKLIFSGCYKELDTIYCCLAGQSQGAIEPVKRYIQMAGKKFVILAEGPGDTTYERFTLLKLRAMVQPDDKILYFHSKGLTHLQDTRLPNIQMWTAFLEYSLFTNCKLILQLLDTYDTVGVNYGYEPKPHFSGNFWWASGKYLLQLPTSIRPDYYEPEFWIGLAHPKVFQLYNTGMDHYNQSYPYCNYIDTDFRKDPTFCEK